jgi:hypothetical protein
MKFRVSSHGREQTKTEKTYSSVECTYSLVYYPAFQEMYARLLACFISETSERI